MPSPSSKRARFIFLGRQSIFPKPSSSLAKLSAGDLIAQDAMYYLCCLVSLYNRARETKAARDSDPDALNHGIAFAELVSYIEDVRTDTEVAPIFKLADLVLPD